ncbi:MAG TPA: chemotaxis response regulator protein-glutamate methylesterase [Clostridia bacterium]|nr:chemotaxis response regulator protein-glutamate methylesterase [Clostridia bacterium]
MVTSADKKIRVLIIDDSAFMRRIISDMLNSDGNIEVAATARNGKEGMEKAIAVKPDIITLDVEMPVMNGLETLAELMKLRPVPKIIMLSSLTYEGGEATIKALELGALDFVAKPTASILNFDAEHIKDELTKKINSIGKSTGGYFPQTQFKGILPVIKKNTAARVGSKESLKYLIAIGTSTGGPRALQEVLTKLPEDIPAAVLVVQHMPPGFTKSLSARLDSLSHINVKEAEEGDVLKPGWAYIAPGDYHMVVNKVLNDEYKISINKESPVTGHRPSVNVMMNSVAECGHKDIIAVMMTGMGSDGSEGILKIKKAGGKTVAQDENTCVVYGMPKSAVNIGAIDTIAPLHNITAEILKNMGV